MRAVEHLGVYAKGWTHGEADTILEATADNYTFNDPNAGVIPKKELARYVAELTEQVKAARGGSLPEPNRTLRSRNPGDPGRDHGMVLVAVPGTEMKGSGLIKVGAGGVRSEVITYHTKLPK